MNIFCIESMWDASEVQTVKPILDLLQNNYEIPYTLKRFRTLKQFQKLCSLADKDVDIFYIASHGEPGVIKGLEESKETVLLSKAAEYLEGKTTDKIIHIASCSTLNTSQDEIEKFFEQTQCAILSGYQVDTNWVESSAMDLVYFDTLLTDGLNSEKNVNKFLSKYEDLITATGFKIIINTRI